MPWPGFIMSVLTIFLNSLTEGHHILTRSKQPYCRAWACPRRRRRRIPSPREGIRREQAHALQKNALPYRATIGRPVILEQNHIAARQSAVISLWEIRKCYAFSAGGRLPPLQWVICRARACPRRRRRRMPSPGGKVARSAGRGMRAERYDSAQRKDL